MNEVFSLESSRGYLQARELDTMRLKEVLLKTPRKRTRFCMHPSPDHALHEMMILFHRDSYIAPHRHLKKCESFHMIEGALDLALFDDDGEIIDVIEMGVFSSGKTFYYRLDRPLYHFPLFQTEMTLVHETTQGPFIPSEAEIAPWAPTETSPAHSQYAIMLRSRIEAWKLQRK